MCLLVEIVKGIALISNMIYKDLIKLLILLSFVDVSLAL